MKRSLTEFTTRNLVVAHWLDGLQTAFSTMIQNQVRHLPVIDDEGGIIGIISERDFQRAMSIDQPDFTSGRVAQASFDPQSKVRDFMSWPVAAIEETKSVSDAAKIIVDRKISALLVVRSQAVVGIVTTEDLLKALIQETDTGIQEADMGIQEVSGGIRAAIYNSPIGPIAHALANVGL